MRVMDRRHISMVVLFLLTTAITTHMTRPAVSQTSVRKPEESLCVRGARLVQAGDTARAETLLVAHLAKDPNDACALTNLGNLARLRGEFQEARVLYAMAMRSDTADVGIVLNYAAVSRQLKDPSADSLYRRALRISRTREEIFSKLALPQTAEADSLKAADIGALVGNGTIGGNRRGPDPKIRALIGKTFDLERKPVAGPRQTSQTVAPVEVQKANDMVLASLPVYWKN